MEIKKIGRYLEVDASGFLEKVASFDLLQDDWRVPVELVTEEYLGYWGEILHSIYLRGSVAKGDAISTVSDIDTFAVLMPDVEPPNDKVQMAWYRRSSAEIKRRCPQVAGVELVLTPFDSAVDRESVDSFIIEVEAICVHGYDLAVEIEPFRPNAESAFQTRYFREHFGIFRREYPSESEEEQRELLVWLMRRFLRLGMELVMEREQRFTRDLYLCYESFARYYPDKAREMRRAMELAVDPVASEESRGFTDGFGEWLEAEAERCLTEWGQKFAGSPTEH